MFKKSVLFFTIFLQIFLAGAGFAQEKTKLLIVGTIHEEHWKNPNYSPQDLLGILKTYKADIVAIEVRGDNFDKNDFTQNVPEASLIILPYCRENNIDVYPVNWEPNDLMIQYKKALEKLNNNPQEKARIEFAENCDLMKKIKRNSNRIKGDPKVDFYKVNLKSTSEVFHESADFNTAVYGDGPLTGYGFTRNKKIAENIAKLIEQNRGKRIAVFIGAQHKWWLDECFENIAGLKVAQIRELGKIQKVEKLPRQTQAAAKQLDGLLMYLYVLETPEVRLAPDMVDVRGVDIELKNKISKELINAPVYDYCLGMYYYITKDYYKAMIYFTRAGETEDYKIFNGYPLKMRALMRLGNMYDVTGDREKALDMYKKALEIETDNLNWKEECQSYLKEPFVRPK